MLFRLGEIAAGVAFKCSTGGEDADIPGESAVHYETGPCVAPTGQHRDISATVSGHENGSATPIMRGDELIDT